MVHFGLEAERNPQPDEPSPGRFTQEPEDLGNTWVFES